MDITNTTTQKEPGLHEKPKDRGRGGAPARPKNRLSRKRKPSQREGRSEFSQKVVSIRRVARVVAGGRRFSFSVVIILGDKAGSVGVGIGKGGDTAIAIDKAIRDAKKEMIKVKTTESMSIAHEVRAKYSSSEIIIIPVPGKGLVAGSAVRNVLELAGVTDVTGKIFSRSKNKLNIARATMKALKSLS